MSKKTLPAGVPADGPGAPAPVSEKPVPHAPKAVDPAGALPRPCDPLHRVPAGAAFKRYKCRVANYPGFAGPRYVLAANAEDAKRCAIESCGVLKYVASLKEGGATGDETPEPRALAWEMPD